MTLIVVAVGIAAALAFATPIGIAMFQSARRACDEPKVEASRTLVGFNFNSYPDGNATQAAYRHRLLNVLDQDPDCFSFEDRVALLGAMRPRLQRQAPPPSTNQRASDDWRREQRERELKRGQEEQLRILRDLERRQECLARREQLPVLRLTSCP